MSVDPQRDAPAAPAGDPENTVASGEPASAPAPVAPAAPAAAPVVSKAERDRLAAEGRRRAQLEQVVQQQNAQIAQLTQTVASMGAQFSAAEQRRIDQELAQLPPEERALAEVDMLKRRIAGMSSQPTPPPIVARTAPQPDAAYTQQKSREIVDSINAEFGTNLTGDEAGLDWDSERTFELSARVLAMQKRNQRDLDPPSYRPDAQGAVPATGVEAVPAKKDDTSEAAITARVTEQIRRDLGIASPASPQPTGSRAAAGVPTEDDLQKTVQGYKSANGPRANIQKLREQREALAKAANLS